MVPVPGSHQARRKGAVSASRHAFFLWLCQRFITFYPLNIEHFFFFDILILNHINKYNKIIFMRNINKFTFVIKISFIVIHIRIYSMLLFSSFILEVLSLHIPWVKAYPKAGALGNAKP